METPPQGRGVPGGGGGLTILRLESRTGGWFRGAKKMLSRAETETDVPEDRMVQRGASVTCSFKTRGASTTSGFWGEDRGSAKGQAGRRADPAGFPWRRSLAKREAETALWLSESLFQLARNEELKIKLLVLIPTLEEGRSPHLGGDGGAAEEP